MDLRANQVFSSFLITPRKTQSSNQGDLEIKIRGAGQDMIAIQQATGSSSPGCFCIFSVLAVALVTFPWNSGFLIEEWYQKSGSGSQYVHCQWSVIASRSSQLTQQGVTCVYSNLLYTHLQIFLYISTCIYIKLNLTFPNLIHWYMDHSSLSPLLVCDLPLQQ